MDLKYSRHYVQNLKSSGRNTDWNECRNVISVEQMLKMELQVEKSLKNIRTIIPTQAV